jgi:bacillithiol biosynthesis cysteine-adding enzyme BshC
MGSVANHEPECLSTPGELPVKVECLPFSRIPHTTRLFLDFLSHSPQVQQFYPRSPSFFEWLKQETPGQRYDAARRQRVSDALERQNRRWNVSPKTLANIARLRAGASAVVTGQQVGLFGGPLFSILKALTAVKLAEEATAAGVDAVPIFWLATTDHDLAEVNHTLLPGPDASLHPLATPSRGLDEAPVGTVTFGPEIEPVVQSAVELLGATPATDFLRDSYRPGETLGSGFARLFSLLFAEFGVILMDPSDAELHAVAAPIYRAAIERAAELDDALLARGKALEDAGYHQQAKVTPSSTLLFTLKGGARLPIHRRTNGTPATVEFLVNDEKLSPDELLRRVATAPHEFSPNVLLRPVVQDYLLPTLAYTGGAAEVAYFAQTGVVYDKLLGHVTPIVPRFSATIVEQKPKALLDRYGLTLPEMFHGEEVLRETLAAKVLPMELQQAFDRANASVHESIVMVREALAKLDKTLVDAADNAGSKIQHQLESLRARAARAELRQSEVVSRHAQQLTNSLFPNKTLQEREIAALYYLSRYGVEFLSTLYATLQTGCHDHQVVTFD